MPAKAAVRSPERTQTCHDAKAFWGHFQDECEDETEAVERGAFHYYYYFLALTIVSKLSKFYIKPQSVGWMRIRVPWFKPGVSRVLRPESAPVPTAISPRVSATLSPAPVSTSPYT